MALNDIIGLAVLFLAYALTWVLFLRSLRIIKFIDREKLKHLRQIRDRLNAGKASVNQDGI